MFLLYHALTMAQREAGKVTFNWSLVGTSKGWGGLKRPPFCLMEAIS